MRWGQVAALAAGTAVLVWMLAAVGFDTVARSLALGGPALPAAIAVHALQLVLAGFAWWEALGRDWAGAAGLRRLAVARVRWIREGVSTFLPVAQIGGQMVGVRLLVRAGLSPVRAVVGTILDLLLEAGSQVLVVVTAVLVLLAVRGGGERDWLAWAGSGVAGLLAVVAGLAIALRLGALRAVEAGLQRAAARWPVIGSDWSLAGLNAALLERQSDRAAMSRGLALNVLSWSLGTAEVWVLLEALGVSPGIPACFVIESLAMAVRSSGFAIPAAIGVQEGGFLLACGLFGIGAETALALSVLKRVRELLVGAAAMVAWLGVRR